MYEAVLYFDDLYYAARQKLKDLQGTCALTLIRQVPLVAGLAVAVGYAAH